MKSRCTDHSVSFSTKASSLIFHLHLGRKLATARARPFGTARLLKEEPALEEPATSSVLKNDVLPLLMSVVNIGLVTAALLILDKDAATNLVPIAYLIPVIFAATRWGIWPAMLASIAGMAAADFFFFPPIYSFRVEDPQEAVDLVLFLIVSLVSSNLASRLRRETEMLRQREAEIHRLYEFSQRLAACFTVSDLISAIQHYLSRTLGQQATFFVAMADGHYEPSESGSAPSAVYENVASMIVASGVAARTVVDQSTRDVWLLRAVSSETAAHGVIAINVGHGSREILNSRIRRVEAVLEEVSLTLKRLDIGKAMEDARLHLQAQLLRDAFHGTLSHELCSPLAAISGSANVLDSIPRIREDAQAHALVEAISDEATELDGFIQNLLNATRVTAGGVSPHLEWTDPNDIVNAAIKRRTRRLTAHRIETEFAEYLPRVQVDSGLIEEACGQLLENAAKYSPSGSTILVRAFPEDGHLILSVSDQGVGITPDEQQQLGRRSFRGQRHQANIPGSGLGFWIASTFVHANGGKVGVLSRGQGLGTTVSISLPTSHTTASELTASNDE
jgi:two-component system sensor histidine kinase KdpD